MLKIAVVDDKAEVCEIVQRTIKQAMSAPASVNCYTNPELLQFDVQEGITYDVYFLDVEMPVIDGIDLAKYIREHQTNAYIIFLTSHSRFAIYGYDLKIKACYYILKAQMSEYIPKILRSLEKEINERQYYTIENQVRFVRIELDKIYYVKKEGKNIILTTEYGVYKERNTLERFMNRVDAPEFIFVERGCIVNMFHIHKIKNPMITMKNGDVLFMSRENVKKLRAAINDYWGNTL